MVDRPRCIHAPGNDESCADPAQKRTSICHNQTVRIYAATSLPKKQTVHSQIRPHIGSPCQRPAPPKIQIPIDHRLRPAGSGTADFPTPHGVRNSKRKPNGSLQIVESGKETSNR